MITVPETTSYRTERDQKDPKKMRHSVIFTWKADEHEEAFPKEFPFVINGKLVTYRRTDQR